jgi:GcrA cell cycle regulator
MTMETWTPERVERLRTFMDTGLSCSQIAAQIGVSRNAVIGKIHRLGLAPGRPAGAPARSSPPRAARPRFSSQRQLLRLMSDAPVVAGGAPALPAANRPVESVQICSLLELTQGKCRWPVSEADAADIAFCGNDAIGGFSYCTGHARMAYRSSARRRA